MTLLTTEGGAGGNANGANGASGAGGSASGAGGAGSGGSQSAGSGSGGAASWRDTLPEDLRGNATLGKFSDVNSLAKSYVEIQGLVGKKGVFPPGEKATKEQWGEFFKQIGQPEFDKFGVKLPEGIQVNQGIIDGFKKTAHESGLLPQQAQGVLDWFLGAEQASVKARKDTEASDIKTKHEELKKEWGINFDKQIAQARLAAKEVGGEEFQQYLEDSGLGNNVHVIKMLAKAGALLGEDRLRGDGGGGALGQTLSDVQDQIDRIQGDLKHPYFDRSHPGHALAVRQMEDLYKKRYSGT